LWHASGTACAVTVPNNTTCNPTATTTAATIGRRGSHGWTAATPALPRRHRHSPATTPGENPDASLLVPTLARGSQSPDRPDNTGRPGCRIHDMDASGRLRTQCAATDEPNRVSHQVAAASEP
jgi:hypothetical protein